MKHGSLFSGIGGFDLASQWAGFENVFQVEIDSYCRKVLKKNFPKVKRYKDIKDFDGTEYTGTVDIISGGFPCQPFSMAGKRRGKEDDRHLWPEMLRVIGEVKPSWVVGENVPGIVKMELDTVLSDLEAEGYTCETFIIPACGVDSPHRRDRVWVVGYTNNSGSGIGLRNNGNGKKEAKKGERIERSEFGETGKNAPHSKKPGLERPEPAGDSCTDGLPAQLCEDVADPTGQRFRGGDLQNNTWDKSTNKQSRNNGWGEIEQHLRQWPTEPGVGRVADGIPRRVDRLKGLGNAIVPQLALVIFEAIKEIEANQ